MQTYVNKQLRILSDGSILMDDGGDPPVLGETVSIDGMDAKVTASSKELQNDSSTGGRFIAVYAP